MFGYDRINERFLLENVNRFEMTDWERAKAEHMEMEENIIARCIRVLREVL